MNFRRDGRNPNLNGYIGEFSINEIRVYESASLLHHYEGRVEITPDTSDPINSDFKPEVLIRNKERRTCRSIGLAIATAQEYPFPDATDIV